MIGQRSICNIFEEKNITTILDGKQTKANVNIVTSWGNILRELQVKRFTPFVNRNITLSNS